jgi:hypothetical protein
MIISFRTMAGNAIRITVRICTTPCRRSATTNNEHLNSKAMDDRKDHSEEYLEDLIVWGIEPARDNTEPTFSTRFQSASATRSTR